MSHENENRNEFAQGFDVWLFSLNRKAERAHKEICQAAEEERSMSTQMKELMEFNKRHVWYVVIDYWKSG